MFLLPTPNFGWFFVSAVDLLDLRGGIGAYIGEWTLCVLESAHVSKHGQSVVRGGRGSMLDLRVPAFGSDFPVNHSEIKRGKGILFISELNPSLSTFKTHGKVQ